MHSLGKGGWGGRIRYIGLVYACQWKYGNEYELKAISNTAELINFIKFILAVIEARHLLKVQASIVARNSLLGK